jgi:uncharacterized membrane protein YphA (DoxX/SURF4 family)
MNIFLWVVQALLAAVFLFAGGMKFFGIEKVLKDATPGPGKLSLTKPMLHFIGVSELVGCLGVILPMLTGVMPQLTPTAAAGLTLVMILATGFHIQRKDPASKSVTTLILSAFCAFVAYGRGMQYFSYVKRLRRRAKEPSVLASEFRSAFVTEQPPGAHLLIE